MNKVAIFGVPRSGTSWLSQIFNSHPDVAMRFQPLFSFQHKGRLTETSSAEEIGTFFEEILYTEDAFALMQEETHRNYPRFRKSSRLTHIAFKETRYLNLVENILRLAIDVRVIGIVRNPLANLASWMAAPKEFGSGWSIEDEWRFARKKNQDRPEEFFGFERWKTATANFVRFSEQFPDRFRLVSYAHLRRDAFLTAEKLLAFCNLKMDAQVESFLAASRARHDEDPYSVFRGKANDRDWRSVVPPEIASYVVDELHGTDLEVFLEE